MLDVGSGANDKLIKIYEEADRPEVSILMHAAPNLGHEEYLTSKKVK